LKRLSSEFLLLLEVSQISPSPSKVVKLLKEGVNQTYLLSLAIANGVLPLLYKELSKYQEITLIKDFKEKTLEIKNLNFFMSAQLLQITYMLKQKEIQTIPIKGPLLAQHAYKEIDLRPFSDLDILACEHDLLEISNILLTLGYKNEDELTSLTHPYILKKFTDTAFVHPDTGVVIELHWKLLKTASAALSDIPTLFKASMTFPFQNTELNSLPLEEEFLYLCIHASKHRWERIEWMNDINYLFEHHQNRYNWKKLLQMAKNENSLTSYLLGLYILNRLYGRSYKHAPTQRLSQKKKINTLYMKVMELHSQDYIMQKKKNGIRWMEVFFSIKLEDSYIKKFHLFTNLIFPLYKKDILAAPNLPKYLRFSYHLKRLQRLVKKIFSNK